MRERIEQFLCMAAIPCAFALGVWVWVVVLAVVFG